MDFYAPKVGPYEHHLLDFWPEAGTHVLRLTPVAKNHLSSGEGLLLESLRLRQRRPRVKEMGHDRDRDWRTNPVLYD
jgi:hypothetical protein